MQEGVCDCLLSENLLTSKVLKYGDIAGLEQSIDMAHQIASRRLFEVFFDKFKLLDHLTALKNYLLLGHGDFADQLMETLRYVILYFCISTRRFILDMTRSLSGRVSRNLQILCIDTT